jgi:hypothetical protein
MVRLDSGRCAAVLVAGALAVAAATPAGASVITSTPTLPLLGVPYTTSPGANCFPLAGVCFSDATFTLTTPVSSSFNAAGQDITSGALYSATLTDLSDNPLGTLELTGTAEQEVLGRTSSTELGSWTTDLVSLSLSGPLLGHTLTLSLDTTPGHESTGETSIEQIDRNRFRIDSFFDVFVDLTLDTLPPLHTTRGPIHATAGTIPEPPSIAAIAAALALMPGLYRRRGAVFPKTRIV